MKKSDDNFGAAIDEFLSKLPEEMVELAWEGVQLQQKLEEASSDEERREIENLLELNKNELIMSASNHIRNRKPADLN